MSISPVTPKRPLRWPASVDAIRSRLPRDEDVYLVGGAVRDAYLGLPLHDIDLATPGDGRPLARHIANTFNGAYYTLDQNRGVGRALIPWENQQIIIDVAQFRGPDLLIDLQMRDFTLNAMAVRLTGDLQTVIDPTGGLVDLERKQIRRCTPDSIRSDPVRTLRAVRASLKFGLRIETATRQDIKQQAPQLHTVSAERIRDEFIQLLGSKHPAAALNALDRLGLLAIIVPETTALAGLRQSAPHQFDVWRHTLNTITQLNAILSVFEGRHNDNLTANLPLGSLVFALGTLREQLKDAITHEWPNHRTHRTLMMLAALLHDCGKPATYEEDDTGRIRFLRHEQVGARLAGQRADTLRLSKGESRRIHTIVLHHMRPLWLASNGQPPSPRAIYRFWRDLGPAGIDVCLLSLADMLGTYGHTLNTQDWLAHLELIHTLLDAYFLRRNTAVSPPALVSGRQLIKHLGLDPGPQIGELLEYIREGQVSGTISTKKEALELAQRLLEDPPGSSL